ncbi:hypothetical protein PV11_08483 [Exophiala sideris]|uniref:Uncharacterized protein n=1 Tax=Exophiala sideris TaxID=1016849 RepID=A0A0D1VXJ1_9EURO|nr:hypothetical protein PV11_08483 [Exophiala sideris]
MSLPPDPRGPPQENPSSTRRNTITSSSPQPGQPAVNRTHVGAWSGFNRQPSMGAQQTPSGPAQRDSFSPSQPTSTSRQAPGSSPLNPNQQPPGPGQTPRAPSYSPITPSRTQSPRAPSYSPITPDRQRPSTSDPSASGTQQVLSIRPKPNDPEWPINRGYVCHSGWTPNEARRAGGAIMVEAGDEGCILRTSGPETSRLCFITIPRRQQQGWVPMSQKYLNIGQAIYGRTTLKGDFPLAPAIVQMAGAQVSRDLYPSTVYATLVALGGEAHKLLVPESLASLLRSDHFRREITGRIEEGARRAGGLYALNRHDFTLRKLTSLLRKVGPEHAGLPGIYKQVLSNFINEPQRLPESRDGKTNNLWVRSQTHTSCIQNKSRGNFYDTAQQAQLYEMFMLIRDLDSDDARTLAEVITILQFGDFRADLFNPPYPGEASHSILNKSNAKYLMQVARAAFATTGWQIATERPSYGCTVGHNVTSPLHELGLDAAIWTRTNTAKMATFRRLESTIGANGRFFRIDPGACADSSTKFNVVFAFPRAKLGSKDYPAIEDQVFLVAEIMLNGERHPYGWGRLPELAVWSDHALATGIAFKVEWFSMKTGRWMSKYVQISKHDYSVEIASQLAYSRCMALRRYFLRQTFPDGGESWRHDIGKLARVKMISFDNLAQVFTAKDITGSSKGTTAVRVTYDAIRQQLRQAGASNIELPWPAGGRPFFDRPGQRWDKCDLCWILHCDCGKADGDVQTCLTCYSYGIVCSWTNPVPPELKRLLTIKRIVEEKFEEIWDPQLRLGFV